MACCNLLQLEARREADKRKVRKSYRKSLEELIKNVEQRQNSVPSQPSERRAPPPRPEPRVSVEGCWEAPMPSGLVTSKPFPPGVASYHGCFTVPSATAGPSHPPFGTSLLLLLVTNKAGDIGDIGQYGEGRLSTVKLHRHGTSHDWASAQRTGCHPMAVTQSLQNFAPFDRTSAPQPHYAAPPMDSKALYAMYGEQAGLSRPSACWNQESRDPQITCLGGEFGKLDLSNASTSKGLVHKILGQSPVPYSDPEVHGFPSSQAGVEAANNEEELLSYLDNFQHATEELDRKIKSSVQGICSFVKKTAIVA
eukprot:8029644-Pyramimonas_sp.AAC.2